MWCVLAEGDGGWCAVGMAALVAALTAVVGALVYLARDVSALKSKRKDRQPHLWDGEP